VDAVQVAGAHAFLRCSCAQAHPVELRQRENTMLSRSQIGNLRV
jgi:hypothetical protein